MHDGGADIREVVLAQVHRRSHDLAPVVSDALTPGAWDLGDESVRVRSLEAAADLGAGVLRVVGTRA